MRSRINRKRICLVNPITISISVRLADSGTLQGRVMKQEVVKLAQTKVHPEVAHLKEAPKMEVSLKHDFPCFLRLGSRLKKGHSSHKTKGAARNLHSTFHRRKVPKKKEEEKGVLIEVFLDSQRMRLLWIEH